VCVCVCVCACLIIVHRSARESGASMVNSLVGLFGGDASSAGSVLGGGMGFLTGRSNTAPDTLGTPRSEIASDAEPESEIVC